ncbi:hypothetical protein [Cryobacterium sp. M25]|uniref:hypothetical protein n=1 Tax=Cryobacterium sp. M25 TaxID=2048293 RepID=UPI000CE3DD63|nr:hypothetical protein [Cryobacterium sp. M25]
MRAAAQVRLLMRADDLMSALLRIALDDKQPVQARLVAIRDGLDRAGLASKQEIEIAMTPKRTYEDVLDGVLVDVAEDTDEDPNVIDADVVEDAEAYERDRDRRVAEVAEREGVAPKRKRPLVSNEERAVQERDLFEQAPPEPETRASRLSREQYILARERGDNFSSRGLGMTADQARVAASRRGKARSSQADMS